MSYRITIEKADAKQLPYPDGRFGAVISNSIIHHIREPLGCLQEAARVTRPGGMLYFRDLLRPSDEAELEKLANLYAPAAGISSEGDHQRAWKEDEERESRLVFIGRNLDEEQLRRTFEACQAGR